MYINTRVTIMSWIHLDCNPLDCIVQLYGVLNLTLSVTESVWQPVQ